MIQKFIIDLKLPQENNAFQIQQNLTNLTNSKLRLHIDDAIRKLNINKNETFFIPKIEIDLGTISQNDYLKVFEQKFKIEFEKELKKIIYNSQKKTTNLLLTQLSDLQKINEFGEISNLQNSDFFALKFFILKGYIPWWFDDKNIDLQKTIIKYAKNNPAEFIKFLFSTNKNENKLKISRIFYILNNNNFIEFLKLIFINKYYSQRTDIKYFLRTVEENLSIKELADVLYQVFIEASSTKKEVLESKTAFVNIFLEKSNIISQPQQKKILTKTKTIFEETKDFKLEKVVDEAIRKNKIEVKEKGLKKTQKIADKENLTKNFAKDEIIEIEKYQEIIKEYEKKEFLRKNFTQEEIKAIERYLKLDFKYNEAEILNKVFTNKELKTIEQYLDIKLIYDEVELQKEFSQLELKIIEKYQKLSSNENENLHQNFTQAELKIIEKYHKLSFNENENLQQNFTQAELKTIKKFQKLKSDKKEIIQKFFTQAELKILEKYQKLNSEELKVVNQNFSKDELNTIQKYKKKEAEELEVLNENFTKEELKIIEKYEDVDFEKYIKETLSSKLTREEIKAIEKYIEIDSRYNKKEVLDKKFSEVEKKAVRKFLKIVEYDKKEVLGKKFSKTELLSIQKYLDLISNSDENQNKIKEFGLELFDYEFIKNLLFTYFSTNVFPRWSEKIYNDIKATKRLRSDIQIVEYIFSFVSKKYYQQFIPDFYSFISQKEIAKILCQTYPNSFVLKMLTFLYQSKIKPFNLFYQKITNYLEKNTNLSSYKILVIVNHYFIINYKNIFENITEQNIDEFFDKLFEKNIETFFDDLFVKTDLDKNFAIQQDMSQRILDYKKLVTFLIEKGSLPDNLTEITREEIFDSLKNIDSQFFIHLLQTDTNRFVFVSLLPENIIIIVLQKLFGEKFSFFSQILTELNLILNKLKISNRLNKEIQKYLYITAFELIVENVADKNMWLQKYFSVLKNFFRINLPEITFEDSFFEIISSIQKQRIPIFENFAIKQGVVFVNHYTSGSFIENNIKTIGFNLIYYLKNGYLHWSFPFGRLQKLAELISNNKEQIFLNFSDDLQDILFSKLAIQRLFTLFNSKMAEVFLEDLHSKTVDAEKIIEQDKIEKLKELKNLFPDKDLEETYEQIVQEKIDWVNEPEDIEKIYVKNAGLVILCNFLSFLFKRTKLIVREDKRHVFKDEEAQHRAVLLTQYLVSGNEEFKEHELILNKIICGVELRKPINTKLKLTDKEKEEAELLLKSVIGHWKILGSTSVDGLRETFLRREGVISLKNSTYNIIVEQKAIDVLMSSLPWTFLTIKLSWTDYVIYVEWNF